MNSLMDDGYWTQQGCVNKSLALMIAGAAALLENFIVEMCCWWWECVCGFVTRSDFAMKSYFSVPRSSKQICLAQSEQIVVLRKLYPRPAQSQDSPQYFVLSVRESRKIVKSTVPSQTMAFPIRFGHFWGTKHVMNNIIFSSETQHLYFSYSDVFIWLLKFFTLFDLWHFLDMERAQMSFANKQPPKKKRKSRTAFTNHQIFELEKRFLYQKYLSPADRDEIAASLGLSNAQVTFVSDFSVSKIHSNFNYRGICLPSTNKSRRPGGCDL